MVLAKDVLLNPEHSFNMVLEQWSSQLAWFAIKLQSLQLDMAEFACVNAIMLFEQGKRTSHQRCAPSVVGAHASYMRPGGRQQAHLRCVLWEENT